MRYFDFSIAPGSVFNLAVRGDFFRYYSGSAGGGDETIIVRGVDTGNVVLLKPGQSVRFDEQETRWELLNYAGAGTITGFVVVGAGEIRDDRIVGDVSVIDGSKSRVEAGLSFIGMVAEAGAAGNYSCVQFFNPVASGKKAFITNIDLSVSVATGVAMRGYNTQLGALYSYPRNKKDIPGTPSVMELRNGNFAAQSGSQFGYQLLPAAQVSRMAFVDPLMVAPGAGICLFVAAPGATTLSANFQHFESAL